MRQKLQNPPFKSFFCWFTYVSLTLIFLGNQHIWADTSEVPGLPIARFALPSIAVNNEAPPSSGTSIGEKVIELNKEIQSLETRLGSLIQSTRETYDKVILEVNQYHTTMGEIEATLQLGTTPANPKLVTLKSKALLELKQIFQTIQTMNALDAEFSKSLQYIKNLTSRINDALQLPGAVDEDHARLILFSDELRRIEALIGRIIKITHINIQRQSEWLNIEQKHFGQISTAIETGKTLLTAHPLAHPKPLDVPDLKSHQEETLHPRPLKKLSRIKEDEGTTDAQSSKASPTSRPSTKPNKDIPSFSQSINSNSSPQEPSLNQPLSLKLDEAEVISPHSKFPPISEEERLINSPISTPEKIASYTTAGQERPALAQLEPHQEIRLQKWYLYSAAKRGLKDPSDIIDIVNIVEKGTTSQRGEEVKSILIQMGLNPSQLHVINVEGDKGQAGQVQLLFSGR